MPATNHHHLTTTTTTNYHDHPTPPPPKPNPKLLSIFLKFIVMSLILSLFLVFIGLAAILLIHLLLAGSFLHRRRRHRLVSSPDIHHRLPSFQYTRHNPASDDDCSICLEWFNEGEICRVIPGCDHVFHAKCVDKWLMKVPSCPICRMRVRFDSSGGSSSGSGMGDDDDDRKFLWAVGVAR